MKDDLRVHEAEGQRWELGLDLLEAGTGAVSLADVRLYRDGLGPQADGTLHIQLRCPGDPTVVTQSAVERAVAHARRVIDLAMGGPRLAQLMAAHPVVWELIDDYNIGYIPLAVIDQDGRVEWAASSPKPPWAGIDSSP